MPLGTALLTSCACHHTYRMNVAPSPVATFISTLRIVDVCRRMVVDVGIFKLGRHRNADCRTGGVSSGSCVCLAEFAQTVADSAYFCHLVAAIPVSLASSYHQPRSNEDSRKERIDGYVVDLLAEVAPDVALLIWCLTLVGIVSSASVTCWACIMLRDG
jgi:hypothetical protein